MSKTLKPNIDFSQNWEPIERCLETATKAEHLRQHARRLREASRLIRQESARVLTKVTGSRLLNESLSEDQA
ncbi:MAG TPA: hypothetical protein VF075_12855 [Pyrinomonadaceae bacterium]